MNILYLQKNFSKNPNPLHGTQLYEELERNADNCRKGYVVIDADEAVGTEYPDDFVTSFELKKLQPDLIFIEGGNVELGGRVRMSANDIERCASAGAVVVVADVDFNALNQNSSAYKKLQSLFGVSFGFEGEQPAELFDDRSFYKGHRQIIVQPDNIDYDPQFQSIYENLDPFIVTLPVPLRSWSQLIATCNRTSTQGYYVVGGHSFPDPVTSAFASAKQVGSGYVVLIAGAVSADGWVDLFPANLVWIKRLTEFLVEKARIDRRRGKTTHQVFVSHRHSNASAAARFRDELRRRGFGTWLDVRELIPGDRLRPEIIDAIESSTHFAVLWSRHCLDAPWIKLEIAKAMELNKRMFVIRLDETPPPQGSEALLRIEAQALAPEEVARLVAISIEREERNMM